MKATTRHRPGHAVLVLSVSAGVLLGFSNSGTADEPDTIYVTGKVIDFLKAHPDFSIDNATGHVANNVSLATTSNRPIFEGDTGTAGFEVATQWRTSSGRNIAPHLFYNGGALQLGTAPSYNPSNVTIDSWNSSDGTYGGENVGDAPPFEVGASMPTINAPTGLPPHPTQGNVNSNVSYSAGVHTISSSFQVRNLTLNADTTLQVAENSNLIIYTTQSISLGSDCQILVPTSSTLHIYTGQGIIVGQRSQINMVDPLDPHRCLMYIMGSQGITFHQDGKVCAKIVAPSGGVQLDQNDELFGTVVARGLSMSQNTALHWDGIPMIVCGEHIADQLGLIGTTSAGAVTSASTFSQWFTDVLGTNLSNRHTIALRRNGSGIYEYLDDAFFPIDQQLFGNEGDAHNFNFTFMFTAEFEHRQCDGGFFEFVGADDVWVYIDGKLAMDLGGVMPLTPQIIETDRMDLVEGEQYKLHFFFAQRNSHMSVFRLRTNIPLVSDDIMTVTAKFD